MNTCINLYQLIASQNWHSVGKHVPKARFGDRIAGKDGCMHVLVFFSRWGNAYQGILPLGFCFLVSEEIYRRNFVLDESPN